MFFLFNQMRQRWKRIKAWLQVNAPQLLEHLNPGATKADFIAVETAIGKRLPLAFKNFYKIHNGQSEGSDGLIDTDELLSTTRMVQEWTTWKELLDEGTFKDFEAQPDPGIKNTWFNQYWLPITYDGAGNHYCMDLDPAEGGKVSQIITMDHEDGRRKLLAPTFKAFIKEYVMKLESGEYVYSANYGGIIDKKKLEAWEAG